MWGCGPSCKWLTEYDYTETNFLCGPQHFGLFAFRQIYFVGESFLGIHALVRESLDENEMRPESENFSRPRRACSTTATMSFLDITEAYNTQSEERTERKR